MHRLEKELRERFSEFFGFIDRDAFDGIWYWDIETGEEWYSPKFCRLLGYEPEEVPSESTWWQEHIYKEDCVTALASAKKHLDDPSHPFNHLVRYVHKNGSTIWVRCRGVALRPNGKPTRFVGTHIDVTDLVKAREELEHQAMTDPLTGLLNRRGVAKALDDDHETAEKNGLTVYAALIDLDDFKRINEAYGHAVGDKILKEAARRMRNALRSSDHCGRIGGDEFLAVLCVHHKSTATSILERMRSAMAQRYEFSEGVNVTLSAALVRVCEPAETECRTHIEAVLTKAGPFLRLSKEGGKNTLSSKTTIPPPRWASSDSGEWLLNLQPPSK